MRDLGFSSDQYMCMETVQAAEIEDVRAPAAHDRKGFGDIAARKDIIHLRPRF